MDEFLEVCSMHSHLFSSCDCWCTCNAQWPDWNNHDPKCRSQDPQVIKKAGNRKYLIPRR